MGCDRGRLHGFRRVMARAGLEALALVSGVVALILAGAVPGTAAVQQSATAPTSLMFDGVTVVDVEHGTLIPKQRVVIAGNRIQAMGDIGAVKAPQGAQVVEAQGKYLIPGLWDLHTHLLGYASDVFYPLFIANGVTGIRDAWSEVPLDTLRRWRQEILVGTRVGPPRQILSGVSINEAADCERGDLVGQVCVSEGDSADARKLVSELKAAGADMLKMYDLSAKMYFVIAAEARRVDLPFGGHVYFTSAQEASDSGAGILDHLLTAGLNSICWGDDASLEECQPLADHLRHNGTWYTLTLVAHRGGGMWVGRHAAVVFSRFSERLRKYWEGATLNGDSSDRAVGDSTEALSAPIPGSIADSLGNMYLMQRVNLPILAGTDAVAPHFTNLVTRTVTPGFSLHAELAMEVAEGLTPLNALQTATLNPAKFLHATDSLGTVAPGKLADLVLLDADPLADINNTTTIRAVVANGRYFDRAALDSLLAEVRVKVKQEPAKP
jgi:hypothetical protein